MVQWEHGSEQVHEFGVSTALCFLYLLAYVPLSASIIPKNLRSHTKRPVFTRAGFHQTLKFPIMLHTDNGPHAPVGTLEVRLVSLLQYSCRGPPLCCHLQQGHGRLAIAAGGKCVRASRVRLRHHTACSEPRSAGLIHPHADHALAYALQGPGQIMTPTTGNSALQPLLAAAANVMQQSM